MVRWIGLVVTTRPSRSRCTGATNTSRTGVVEAAAGVEHAGADGVGRQGQVDRVDQIDHRAQGVVQRRLDALEVDQGADGPEQVAQQLAVAALRREGDDDRVASGPPGRAG